MTIIAKKNLFGVHAQVSLTFSQNNPVPNLFFNSISLRVIMFGSSRLGGLLNRLLTLPPIPFESGVDFSLNCSVCLVKVTVFNLCHLVPHFQKRCKVCKFGVFRFTPPHNCPICLVKLTVLNLCLSAGMNP